MIPWRRPRGMSSSEARPRLKVDKPPGGAWTWAVYTFDGLQLRVHDREVAPTHAEALAVGLAELEATSLAAAAVR